MCGSRREREREKEREREREKEKRERVKKQLTSNGLLLVDRLAMRVAIKCLDGNKSNGEEVYSANEPVTEY